MPGAVNNTGKETAIARLLQEITASDIMGIKIPIMSSMCQEKKTNNNETKGDIFLCFLLVMVIICYHAQ